MGTLFGFVVGYVLGARVGSAGFDEVARAVEEVRASEQFRGLLDVLRRHTLGTIAIVAERLAEDPGGTATDLVQQAKDRAARQR